MDQSKQLAGNSRSNALHNENIGVLCSSFEASGGVHGHGVIDAVDLRSCLRRRKNRLVARRRSRKGNIERI